LEFTYLGIIFILFFALQGICKLVLDFMNYKHRLKNLNFIPEELEGFIDKVKLEKINLYSNDKLKFSLAEFVVENIIILLIIFLGVISFYYNFIVTITTNIYLIGFIFFITYFLLQFLIGIPFSLYLNFVIEKKFGFNKMSIKLWFLDMIKMLIMSLIINAILLFPLMFFLFNFTNFWFILVWLFILVFSLFIQIIYPNVIAPLFNKFEPLKNEDLKSKIEHLIKECGFKSDGIFEMDASKRTTHGNAYFAGIGNTKRIVLFDTLLKNHTDDEILSILAHELGHFKHKHILKSLIFSAIFSLIGLFLINFIIDSNILYETFKFHEKFRIIGLFLIWIVFEPVMFFISPVSSYFSRKNEYQADRFAKFKM